MTHPIGTAMGLDPVPLESEPLIEQTGMVSSADPSRSEVAEETYAGWAELVERIRTQETDGMAELYDLFSKGIRYYLCRQLGPQDLDDKVHDTFVVVVQAIRRGEIREIGRASCRERV